MEVNAITRTGEVKTIFILVALSRVWKSRKILPELLQATRFIILYNATLLSALFVMGILGQGTHEMMITE